MIVVFWLKVPHSNRLYCQVVYTLAEDIFSRCLALQAEIRMVGVCSRAQSLLGT